VDDARQIDANAGMSAPENEAKCLKGQKAKEMKPRTALWLRISLKNYCFKQSGRVHQQMMSYSDHPKGFGGYLWPKA
jgi:hypothetical protein